mmetsp:Transcript_29571/g.43638  ORF Transcript_29571/g.43638 Transcript_29571/m.43638 type:complete len:366 (-) Transcript_29571:110-1207(-)
MPSSCISAKQHKIDALKKKHSRWLDERKVVTDAENTTREIEWDNCGSARQCDANQHQRQRSSYSNSSTALQKVLERVSVRVRDEIQKEFAPTFNQQDTMSSHLAVHLEEYLSSELHSHVCQICFELMKAPTKSPMMIFPCGHTFCKECIQRHQSREGPPAKMCPYCREQIKCTAENQPLKQLIDRFASQSDKLKDASVLTICEAFPINTSSMGSSNSTYNEDREKTKESVEIKKYKAEHISCSIRQKILVNELKELANLVSSLNEKKEGLQSALGTMKTEKESVKRHMASLSEQLTLIEEYIEEQSSKIETIDGQIGHHKDQIEVIHLTIETLEGDIEKIITLGKSAGASDEDFCSDINIDTVDH